MKVHWTETAVGHLDAIYAYIAQDSLQMRCKPLIASLVDPSRSPIFPFQGERFPNLKWIRSGK